MQRILTRAVSESTSRSGFNRGFAQATAPPYQSLGLLSRILIPDLSSIKNPFSRNVTLP